MRSLLLIACMAWGWFFLHDQVAVQTQNGFVHTMDWFGLDVRPYFAAAQTSGTNGVLDTMAARVQSDAQRDMNSSVAFSPGVH